MNLRIWMTCLVAALGLSFAIGDDFDRHASNIVILQAKPVQRELGITEAQRAKMNEAADAHRARLQAYGKELQASKAKPDQRKIYQYFLELKDQVLNDLTAPQVVRLRQLSLQEAGLIALADPVIGHRVGLSDKQIQTMQQDLVASQKQIRTVSDETAKPIYQQYKGIKPKTEAQAEQLRRQFNQQVDAQLKPKLSKLAAQSRRKMLRVLTPPEKATWQSLLGKPFKPAKG